MTFEIAGILSIGLGGMILLAILNDYVRRRRISKREKMFLFSSIGLIVFGGILSCIGMFF